MTTVQEQNEIHNKIIAGVEKAYEKLLETKRQQNLEIAIMKKGKIVRVKP